LGKLHRQGDRGGEKENISERNHRVFYANTSLQTRGGTGIYKACYGRREGSTEASLKENTVEGRRRAAKEEKRGGVHNIKRNPVSPTMKRWRSAHRREEKRTFCCSRDTKRQAGGGRLGGTREGTFPPLRPRKGMLRSILMGLS